MMLSFVGTFARWPLLDGHFLKVTGLDSPAGA
jgi:hypothetical protein